MGKLAPLGKVSAVALLGSAVPAFTQTPAKADGNVDLAEIIITARKRDEMIQDVPAVVSALTRQKIDDLGGLSNARDLVSLVPGVTFIEAAAGPIAEPNIRGAGQARLPNSDAAIGLYRNGAYIVGGNLGGRTFQRFDLFDVERTEVLRGPQGALYGRNAVGGAINVISAKPEFDTSGELSLIGGSESVYGAQAIVNHGLSDELAVRAGVDFEQQESGFYFDTFKNKFQDQSSYIGGRLSARYRPSEDFEMIFAADYGRDRGDPGTTIPLPDPDGNDFSVALNSPNESGSNQYNLSLGITSKLSAAEFVSTTNYRSRKSFLNNDSDGTTSLGEFDTNEDEAETFFQELRVQGENDRLNWIIGADLFYLRDDYFQTQTGRAIIPATMTMAAINPNITQLIEFSQTSYSAFASVERRMENGFAIEAEGRYSVDDKSHLVDARRADGTPRYSDFPPGSPQTMPSAVFKNTSVGLTASYKWNDQLLTFARAATAYRAGGFNAQLGNPCGVGETPGVNCNLVDVPIGYDEENSINYEIGAKLSVLENRLFLNANAYLIKYDDILANLNNGIMPMVDPLNGALFLDNAGNATAWGYEIEMAYRPKLPKALGQLTFGGSVARQLSEFDSVAPGIITVVPGNDLARLRPWAFTGNFVWRIPANDKARVFFSGNLIHEEGGFQNAENSFILDDYTIVNASVGVEWDKVSITARVANLFDERRFTNQSGTATNGIGTAFRRNDPRSFKVAARYRW